LVARFDKTEMETRCCAATLLIAFVGISAGRVHRSRDVPNHGGSG
jgi:hypothetical protein